MKAVFLRALEERDDKAGVLRAAVSAPAQALGRTRFEVETGMFAGVPRSPFAYWAGVSVLAAYRSLLPLEQDGSCARIGLSTSDDFRFVRLWWETDLGADVRRFRAFAKGGGFSPFYADISLVLRWGEDGRELKAWVVANPTDPKTMHWSRRIANSEFYSRPGLTWSLRTTSELSFRVMPAGGIFGHKGPAAFVAEDIVDELLVLLAITNSRTFSALIELQLAAADAAARSYEVGIVQRTPVPECAGEPATILGEQARIAWSHKRSLDTRTESSHAFHLPALLQMAGVALAGRMNSWFEHVFKTDSEITSIQRQIDDLCFHLYGIDDADRYHIGRGFSNEIAEPVVGDTDDAEDAEPTDLDAVPLVAALMSWAVGASFGRFDMRLATGERLAPIEPEPFDPLPVCSPGMLTADGGYPVDAPPPGYPIDFPRDGILVDDAGAPRDLVAACRQVFDLLFEDPTARWDEASEILEDRATGLRNWLAKDFFEQHIKSYSKSRRKAPIYWQLATPSASCSVWLYYHRFTRDTLFRVLNDHVIPKLQHEERKLTNMHGEASSHSASAQRKSIDAQEALLGELRSMRDEVARVAPLWNPNLNDGVILNFAPLWRLVPQHSSWQKECKLAWDQLCKGEYDWAHLAMHLWPERVVAKCAKDRSLAIAHGLEDVFWLEGADGNWQERPVPTEEVKRLIEERTSVAAREALRSLSEAPTPAVGRCSGMQRNVPARRMATQPSPKEPSLFNDRSVLRAAVPRADPEVLTLIRRSIADLGGKAAKAEILAVADLTDGIWVPAIKALLADGSVIKTGEKRGTRYQLAGGVS